MSKTSRPMKPDRDLSASGLPYDLRNGVTHVLLVLRSYKRGKKSEEEARAMLRRIYDFDGYYTKIVADHNKQQLKDGRELYDVAASIAEQRRVIPNPQIIASFDAKISELKAQADMAHIDEVRITQLVQEIFSFFQ